MKFLLVGINAKYIHSNMAVHLLKHSVTSCPEDIVVSEFTINQSVDRILRDIYHKQADVLCLSCYIWNIDVVLKIIRNIKKINQEITIILGGPEVSYGSTMWMEKYKEIDCIVEGEGEETFLEITEALRNEKGLHGIQGIVYRCEDEIIANPKRKPMSMDVLPFIYQKGLAEFENRILYYESSRGCPFNCQYCISSIEKGVRYRSLPLVKEELQMLLSFNVQQVKFVDRTFNSSKKHAMEIWKFLMDQDNGVTNFHFEIAAELLDGDMVETLGQARAGLFQFEIGVQSTHQETLSVISRKSDFEHLSEMVVQLQQKNNIHLHLDLIAGLPAEDLASFQKSFNDVYKLHPDQLQLGFLKVLRGSGMEELCQDYGITYREYAPYEVLETGVLSYLELEELKGVEEMLEEFYNSGRFYYSIHYIEVFFEHPFELYRALYDFYVRNYKEGIQISKIGYFTLLRNFALEQPGMDERLIENVLKMDFCLLEKVKSYPDWMHVDRSLQEAIKAFYQDVENINKYLPELIQYDAKQIQRMAHIEIFDYEMVSYGNTKFKELPRQNPTAILFNYHQRDTMRHRGTAMEVKLI